jgi:hypothetical protein
VTRPLASGGGSLATQGARLLAVRPSPERERRTIRWLLVILLLWTCALRAWYATPRLDAGRFYDERFPLANASRLLVHGMLRPANGLHPGLAHLPHTALLAASQWLYHSTGRPELAVVTAQGEFTQTAYLLCRLLQVVLGTASVLLVFCIGRRLGGDRLGGLAAFLIATVPWHLRQSVVMKADIVLIFSLCLAFWLSLRAVAAPGARTYAAAGLAIGLALSSKFNAGPIAIPLTVGSLFGGRPLKRSFLLLVLAGIVSLGVFLALNPYVLVDFEIYRRSMGGTVRAYARDGAEAAVTSPLDLLLRAFGALLSPGYFGLFVGSAALLGLAAVSFSGVVALRRSTAARSWLMLASYVAGYLGLYAAVTSSPKSHSWLPVAPFLALTAAWALLAAWRLVARSLPHRARGPASLAAAALLIGVLAASASRFVYAKTLPRTGDLVLADLVAAMGRHPGRLVVSEHDFDLSFNDRNLRGHLAIDLVPRMSALTQADLDLADAEVFPAERLTDPDPGVAAFFTERSRRVEPDAIVRYDPKLFVAHGPSLYVLFHFHHPLGQLQSVALTRVEHPSGRYVARLPREARRRGRLVSVQISLPRKWSNRELSVETPRGHAALLPFRHRGHLAGYLSPRFATRGKIRLRIDPPGDDHLSCTVLIWQAEPAPKATRRSSRRAPE